jgi:hypothetical protein
MEFDMTAITTTTIGNERPDATNQDTRTRAELVLQYKEFARKSAECVLKLAGIVAKASELPEQELRAFCDEVGLEREGSTYRKLRAIGERIDRFEPHAERVPYAWTTLYELAKLSDEEFERVLRSNRLSRTMTAKDLASIVPKQLGKKKVTAARDAAPATAVKKDVTPTVPDDEADAALTTAAEEEVVAPMTSAKKTVSDLKSLVESSTRTRNRAGNDDGELRGFEIVLDLSDLDDDDKRAVYWAIKRLHREHGFTMDAGDGLTRLATPRRAAA